ncbi:cuticle protein CP14.6-like [Penaeus vannamei]|uniref:cuticle protein CP14.6-like n=1 Tax=Penaeus vannamei TaxID=6689 RepID=UPI00387F7F3E
MHSSLVSIAALLMVVALTTARPDGDTILDFDGDNHHHTQQGSAGNVVTGTYGWTSPEGYNFLVKYIADENGYRVVESNAVPINADGIYADGKQGAFESDEYEN